MATYGTTDEYGALPYKQDGEPVDTDNDYLKVIIDLWPLADILVPSDDP